MSFAGKMLLLDPYLGEKGRGLHREGAQPGRSLPIALEEVLDGVDAVVVSMCTPTTSTQRPGRFFRRSSAALPARGRTDHARPRLHRCTPRRRNALAGRNFRLPHIGRHGSGAVLKTWASSRASSSKRPENRASTGRGYRPHRRDPRLLRVRMPDVVLTHPCGAVWDARDAHPDGRRADCRGLPHFAGSTVVAIHMEAVDHATVTRNSSARRRKSGLSDERLRSADGETVQIRARS